MSEIEERHQQQLKELEDAMRNTWEEKARISQVYLLNLITFFSELFLHILNRDMNLKDKS